MNSEEISSALFSETEILAVSRVKLSTDQLDKLPRNRIFLLFYLLSIASVFVAIGTWYSLNSGVSLWREICMVLVVGSVAYGAAIHIALKSSWESLASEIRPNLKQSNHSIEDARLNCILIIAKLAVENVKNRELLIAIVKTAYRMKRSDERRNRNYNWLMDSIISLANYEIEDT